ncbi:MAG: tetratricopeptide repeat protein, partial [Terriglobia bacterium]
MRGTPKLFKEPAPDHKRWGLALLCVAGLLLFCNTGSYAQAAANRGPAAASNISATARFGEAQALLKQGNFKGALGEVQEGLRLEPRSVMGLNLLGIILSHEGKQSEALDALKSALRVEPNSTDTHNNLGDFYLEKGKPDLAENEFRITLRLDPRNRDANYNLGSILLFRHDARHAIEALQRVQPADPATLFRLTQAYFAAHENAKARSAAQALSAREPHDVKVHFSLGVLLASAGQFQPAVHELELADALRPGTFEILHNLGGAYL